MPTSLVQYAWNDLDDLLEVCPECRICSQLGNKLYGQHLYLSHLRRRCFEIEADESELIDNEI